MKQLICHQPGQLEYRDTQIPEPEKDEVLLKVNAVGVCGTDLHAFEGTQPFFSYPRVLGHEVAAEIVETGDSVCILPYFACGKCIACKNDKPNCCMSIAVAGVHTDGGFQEYITVKKKYVVEGRSLSEEQLALVEPLSVAAHGIRRSEIHEGNTVLIMGMGPIGLGLTTLAKAAGAVVIGVDMQSGRLEFAKKHFQIDHALMPSDKAVEEIADLTNNQFCEVVIDATGSIKAIESGLQYLAHGGVYTLVGLQKEPFSFSHPEFHKRETSLRSSRNATIDDFNQVIQMIENNVLDIDPLITHRIPFNSLANRFQTLLNPEEKVIKALVKF